MSQERVERERANYSNPAMWQKEWEIQYEALEGELYMAEWETLRNTCRPFDVSDTSRWTIYHGCDPHGRTPHAFTWLAVGSDAEYRLCGEMWPSRQYSVREYAETIKWLESDSTDKPIQWDWARGKRLHVARRVMDTHGKAVNSDEGVDYFETYRKHGLSYQPANKSDISALRDELGKLMLPDKVMNSEGEWTESPRFKAFDVSTPEFQSECENVRYPQGDPDRASDERPLTYRRHCLDSVVYIFSMRPRFVLRRASRGIENIYEGVAW